MGRKLSGSCENLLKNEKRSTFNQYCAGFVASLFAFCAGNHSAWTAISLPKLHQIIGSDYMDNMLINTFIYGIIFGNLIGFYLPNLIGRKKTMSFSVIPFAASSIISYFADKVTLDFIHFDCCSNIIFLHVISRFISGFACGMIYFTLPGYLCEISTARIRGQINALFTVEISLGSIFQFVIGALLPIDTNASIMFAYPIIALILLHFQPESPYYYSLKHDDKNAIMSLRSLNRSENELIEMQALNKDLNWKFSDLITSKNKRKALLIIFCLNMLLPLSAFSSMQTLLLIILKKGQSPLSDYTSGIIFSAIQSLAFIDIGPFLDKFSRRLILLTSSFGTSVILSALGVYFALDDNFKKSISILSVVLIMVYGFVLSFGICTVPIILAGEIFTTEFRSTVSALMSVSVSVSSILFVEIFTYIQKTYDYSLCFWVFSIILFLSSLLCYKIMPETKGKTLEEIHFELAK